MMEQDPIALPDQDRSERPPPLPSSSRSRPGWFRPIHLLLSLPWLVLLGYLTHTAWFLCDDAFISFRYARNLLEGHGLVFNPGEYVEGYSNFLWVLELAALWGVFGLRPEHTAPWLSVACTVGTLAAMLWWTARLPGLPQRRLVGWMALGLVCSSATFAVWTPAMGLETRQFTFFIIMAVVGLTLYPERHRALLSVSLSLAAASLTRPEGPLFAACCFGWYAVQRRVATDTWRRDWRSVAWLVVPFVMLVGAHFLFRYAYYGEWLPNTYHVKYVRPWYEAGLRYLLVAAVETGLYLLVPLAILTLIRNWRARRSLVFVLPLLCIGLHMGYLARVGGDHFEYRPLDIYWPLLAVPAAVGLVHLSLWMSSTVRRFQPIATWYLAAGPQTCALVLFLPVLFYSGAMQAALLFEGAKIDKRVHRTPYTLDERNAGRLLTVPGIPLLVTISNDLRGRLIPQFIGVRFATHRNFAAMLLSQYSPYQNMRQGVFPSDALAIMGSPGIKSYFLPDLRVIDGFGLTDATIARNPVTRPNSHRSLAHDRRPLHRYLAERRLNFRSHPAETTVDEALERALYAVQVGPDLWLPFDARRPDWVAARFKQFTYNTEAIRRFKDVLKTARLLIRDPFNVYLDGRRLLYVKDRCAAFEPSIFLHIIPRDLINLSLDHRQYGFESHDFNISPRVPSLKRPYDCVATHTLPDYPIAALRTGQHDQESGSRFWTSEFRFAVPEHEHDGNLVQGGARAPRPPSA